MKRRKLWKVLGSMALSAAVLSGAVCGTYPGRDAYAASAEGEDTSGQSAGNVSGQAGSLGAYGEEGMLSSEMLAGNAADVSFSGVSISGSKAGGTVKVSFTVTGNKNSKKHYEIEKIERVYPVLDDSFPFVMDDEAYRVTQGSGNSVNCAYTFKAKDNLSTAYYTANFCVVYSRKAADGKTTAYDSEYFINKSINVKLTAKPVATKKPKATKQPTPEPKAEDADLSLKMKNNPYGVYDHNCSIAFSAVSSKYLIKSVVPVIDTNFPFESTSDAYRVTRSKGTKRLDCHYNFLVKNNVATGYQGVSFRITYVKDGVSLTEDKTVNVELVGKKNEKDAASAKKTTPRVMVVGYRTDVKTVKPNGNFRLTLQIKNNANVTVRNVKFTLSTEKGEFLPVSGASTAYVESIAAKSETSLTFEMKASAGLGSKSYPITVKAEYEDDKANAYSAEDNVSIPVTQKDRISLTEITPPDLSVDETNDLSFSINNLGGGALNNVSVTCKGKEITSEEAFVGNIAAGSTGYANVPLTGVKATPEDSEGKCTIVIKYENAAGEHKKYKEKTNVYVMEGMSDEEAEMMDAEMMEDTHKGLPVPAVVGIAVAAVIVVILIIRHVRKKKRLKKEMMEDELL